MTLIFLIISMIVLEKIIINIYTKSWTKGLSIKVGFDEVAIDEGKKGHITEVFSNDKNLSIPIASIKFELDKSIKYMDDNNVSVTDKQYRCDSMTLRAKRTYKRRFEILYTKRGLYKIVDPIASAKDIFGIYSFSQKYESTSEIYVFPAYSKNVSLIAPFSRTIGEAIKNRFIYEDPFEFKGIRDYTGTEPMKKINWSASAKTGNLKVNSYYDTSSRQATIFLDIANDQIWKQNDQLEECIRICRNYMEGFVRNHIPTQIITNARDIFEGTVICFDCGSDGAFVEQSLRKMSRIDLDKTTEKMSCYFEENSAKDDALYILLSVDQSDSMKKSYEKFLGKNEGEWVCPLSASAKRMIFSKNIHMTYVEVGR